MSEMETDSETVIWFVSVIGEHLGNNVSKGVEKESRGR